jgi:hypothetical protein
MQGISVVVMPSGIKEVGNLECCGSLKKVLNSLMLPSRGRTNPPLLEYELVVITHF